MNQFPYYNYCSYCFKYVYILFLYFVISPVIGSSDLLELSKIRYNAIIMEPYSTFLTHQAFASCHRSVFCLHKLNILTAFFSALKFTTAGDIF